MATTAAAGHWAPASVLSTLVGGRGSDMLRGSEQNATADCKVVQLARLVARLGAKTSLQAPSITFASRSGFGSCGTKRW